MENFEISIVFLQQQKTHSQNLFRNLLSGSVNFRTAASVLLQSDIALQCDHMGGFNSLELNRLHAAETSVRPHSITVASRQSLTYLLWLGWTSPGHPSGPAPVCGCLSEYR